MRRLTCLSYAVAIPARLAPPAPPELSPEIELLARLAARWRVGQMAFGSGRRLSTFAELVLGPLEPYQRTLLDRMYRLPKRRYGIHD